MKITFLKNKQENSQEIFIEEQNSTLTILQILWLHQLFNSKALCSGVGKCGKCKVRFLSSPPQITKDEEQILTRKEIDSGIRLSCKHCANNNYHIEIPEIVNNFKRKDSKSLEKKGSVLASLAIDFGTTSLEYCLVVNGEIVKEGKCLNPMQGVGSEVMTRLEFARNSQNAKILKSRTWECVENIINELKEEDNYLIEKIVFSANSAMTYLALAKDSKNIAFAPYSLDYFGNETLKIEEFPNLPPIYIPPLLAPFIGADISSGLYALNEGVDLKYPYLLIDMGTNAECILAVSEQENYMASVPLGPSVEGIGLTFGAVASNNTILDFSLNPVSLQALQAHFGDGKNVNNPDGICGVAYLHLLQILLKLQIIDTEGHFVKEPKLPLARKIANFAENSSYETALNLPYNFYFSSSDIESILKVKSALRTAVDILLQEANLPAQNLEKVYLAGSFGKYIRKDALIDLGFLPQILLAKIEQVENTSLTGAKLLCTKEAQLTITNKFTNFKHIELANHKDFAELYIKNFTIGNI